MGLKGPLLAVLTALALGGCSQPAEPRGQRQGAIVGGQPAPAEVAVVALAHPGQDISCTGTLISRRLIVTAAHCVDGPLQATFRGTTGAERVITVAASELAPGFSHATLDSDLALVVLAEPAPVGTSPIALAWRAPAPGDIVRFVGFGYTAIGPSGSYGQRREVGAAVTEVGATTFRYGVATCEGDSGGPALRRVNARDELVGVTSTGDPACSLRGVNTRVDSYAEWIASAAARLDPVSCGADAGAPGDCPVHEAAEASGATPGCAIGRSSSAPRWSVLATLLAVCVIRRRTRARKGGSHG